MKNSVSSGGDFDMVSQDQADTNSLGNRGSVDKAPGIPNNNTTTDSDALFQKHYSKELKVNEDEIPFVLAEFTENALRYIKKDQFEKALILLQKAHGIINVISIEN